MDIEKLFSAAGGIFLSPVSQVQSKLKATEVFIFDWDGVFNSGMKTGDEGSPFSEIDSMGINLLRFSRWLSRGKVPYVFIITGENNPSAIKLAQRESFNAAFIKCKDKKQALKKIIEKWGIEPNKIAGVFDDVLDLEIAQIIGLSFWVGRKSTPMLAQYVHSNKVCDYITASPGSGNAVREVCELVMGLDGTYDEAVGKRIAFGKEYQTYLEERNRVEAEVIDFRENQDI